MLQHCHSNVSAKIVVPYHSGLSIADIQCSRFEKPTVKVSFPYTTRATPNGLPPQRPFPNGRCVLGYSQKGMVARLGIAGSLSRHFGTAE